MSSTRCEFQIGEYTVTGYYTAAFHPRGRGCEPPDSPPEPEYFDVEMVCDEAGNDVTEVLCESELLALAQSCLEKVGEYKREMADSGPDNKDEV